MVSSRDSSLFIVFVFVFFLLSTPWYDDFQCFRIFGNFNLEKKLGIFKSISERILELFWRISGKAFWQYFGLNFVCSGLLWVGILYIFANSVSVFNYLASVWSFRHFLLNMYIIFILKKYDSKVLLFGSLDKVFQVLNSDLFTYDVNWDRHYNFWLKRCKWDSQIVSKCLV